MTVFCIQPSKPPIILARALSYDIPYRTFWFVSPSLYDCYIMFIIIICIYTFNIQYNYLCIYRYVWFRPSGFQFAFRRPRFCEFVDHQADTVLSCYIQHFLSVVSHACLDDTIGRNNVHRRCNITSFSRVAVVAPGTQTYNNIHIIVLSAAVLSQTSFLIYERLW